MTNLEDGRQIALVVLGSRDGQGIPAPRPGDGEKRRGCARRIRTGGRRGAPPQVERELTIKVDEILHFSQGPHSDEPE